MAVDRGTFANADVDSSEEVVTIDVTNRDYLWLTFVVGTANLSAFVVNYRVHPSGGYTVAASAAGNYTTPVHPVIKATGDLNVAASGATVHSVKLDVKGVESVQVTAAGTNSTITGYYSLI